MFERRVVRQREIKKNKTGAYERRKNQDHPRDMLKEEDIVARCSKVEG